MPPSGMLRMLPICETASDDCALFCFSRSHWYHRSPYVHCLPSTAYRPLPTVVRPPLTTFGAQLPDPKYIFE